MARLSPSKSATLYKVGTKKEGNDGNIWIVIEVSNGTKRWQLFKKPTKLGSKKDTKNGLKKEVKKKTGKMKRRTLKQKADDKKKTAHTDIWADFFSKRSH